MKTETLIIVLIAAMVLLAAVPGVWIALRRRRSQKLREKFGPEYDYTIEKAGDRRMAEVALEEREKRVSQLDIHALDSSEKDRYHKDWTEIQAVFVDDPSKSVEAANRLITEVMITRGFQVAGFEQRAADLSVIYPYLVSNYRNANAIALKNQRNETSTEELRQAMVYYHSLFEALVGTVDVESEAESEEKKVLTQ